MVLRKKLLVQTSKYYISKMQLVYNKEQDKTAKLLSDLKIYKKWWLVA